jgi:hypothetical protein
MLMRPHDGRINHQPFQIGFARKNRQHVVENAHLNPAIVTPFHGLIPAEPFRQITPAPARTGHPQQRIQKPTVVGARPALTLGPARYKTFDALPLIVPKSIAIHRWSPKISLESDLPPLGNPKFLNRHHDLEQNLNGLNR